MLIGNFTRNITTATFAIALLFLPYRANADRVCLDGSFGGYSFSACIVGDSDHLWFTFADSTGSNLHSDIFVADPVYQDVFVENLTSAPVVFELASGELTINPGESAEFPFEFAGFSADYSQIGNGNQERLSISLTTDTSHVYNHEIDFADNNSEGQYTIFLTDILDPTINLNLISEGSGNQFDSIPIGANPTLLGDFFVGTPMTKLGDVNQDGEVNLLDVQPFVAVLTSGNFLLEADVNEDGEVNLLDVSGFVDLLTGG